MKRIKKGNIEPEKIEPKEIEVEYNEIDLNEPGSFSKLSEQIEPEGLKETERELLKEIEKEITNDYSTQSDTPVKRKRGKKSEPLAVVEPIKPIEPPQIVIPGRLVVKVTDKVFTRLLTTLDSFVSKGDPIDPGLLSLDGDEVEDLIPMAEAMIKSLKLSEHPIAYYFASVGSIYLTNFLMVKALLKNQKKQNANAFKNPIKK